MSKASRDEKAKAFNTAQAKREVEKMHERREAVHDRGAAILASTGDVDDLVKIFGKQRLSRNSTIRRADGRFDLPRGVALPWLNIFDSTGSMQENVQVCFDELAAVFEMTPWLQSRYHIQMANANAQDVQDMALYGTPVVQMTQFEGDNRIAEQLRLIVPGGPDHKGDGGDLTEDYDLAELYVAQAVHTDIYELYGMKGYKFVIGDQVGWGTVPATKAMDHLGFGLPGNNSSSITTAEIARLNAPAWNQFYLQMAVGGRAATRNGYTQWWEKIYHPVGGKVVLIPRPNLLNETQVGIVYLYENAGVTKEQFVEFMVDAASATNQALSNHDAVLIWNALDAAGVDIGAQTRLPNYSKLPEPGAVMTHYRHAWNEGHEFYDQNVTPAEGEDAGGSAPTGTPRKIKWSRWGKS